MKKKIKEITLGEICKQCKKGKCVLEDIVYCFDCNINLLTDDELETEIEVNENE